MASAVLISAVAPDLVFAKPFTEIFRAEKGLLLSFKIVSRVGSALGSNVLASARIVFSKF